MDKKLSAMVAQSRSDGYVELNLGGGPLRLNTLLEFVQDIFPNHTLAQLAITEAEENIVVIAAEIGTSKRAN